MAYFDKRQPRPNLHPTKPPLDPTEARQASPRRMNFRVLMASMAIAEVLGLLLVTMFATSTPPSIDSSSAPQPGSTDEQGAASPTSPSDTSSPTTATPPPKEQTPPSNEVTAPPAPPGNNPGSGTATP